MILNGPPGVSRGVLDALVPEGGVAHAQYPELRCHPIQIQADPIEIGVGGAVRQSRGDRILRRRRLGNRLGGGIEQNGVDIGEFPKHLQESAKLGCRCVAHGARDQFELDTAVWTAIQDARDELPGTRGREGVSVPVKDAEELWPEADKGNHFRAYAGINRTVVVSKEVPDDMEPTANDQG